MPPKTSLPRSRALIASLYWLIPIVFFSVLYFDSLQAWFMGDDFAWLGLLRQVHGFGDLMHALFAPAAQGTIRPWSDRGMFLLFESLFGLDNLPFRICAFVTMAANLTLVGWIARRITGSAVAGASAAILWIANQALTTVVGWNSAYNELLCALFLLGALALLIRYVETGRRAFWWWQLVVFILGFGALEVNVVYPALAAAYILFVVPTENRRKHLIALIPLFCISAAYLVVHSMVAPLPRTGPYKVQIDAGIFRTLAAYWKLTLVPVTWKSLGHAAASAHLIVGVVTLALIAFSLQQLARRRYEVLFFAAWYLISLAPMLPLPDHRTDYYLTIPLIGVSMLAGWGISRALRSAWWWQALAIIPLAAYLLAMIPATWVGSNWWLRRSSAVRALVLGTKAAEAAHPGKTIVLNGVTSALYDDALYDVAITRVGLNEAYLTPASRDTIHPATDNGRLARLILEPGPLRRALTHDEVVLYSVVGDHLRNVTGIWERSYVVASAPDPLPRRVDASNPLLGYLLGPEWFPVENNFRWMPRHATVRLRGPRSAQDRLLLEGSSPRQLNGSVVHLSVTVDGLPLESAEIGNPESSFRRLFNLPPSLIGKPEVLVGISVDRAIHEPGGRELGLTFGTIAIE